MMTRNEAIRTIGDVFANASIGGNEDAHPDIYMQTMLALGVSLDEVQEIAVRAAAEYQAILDQS